MSYIIINEHDDVFKTVDIDEDDIQAADDGYCTIISTADLKIYCGDGVWDDIPVLGSEETSCKGD